MEQNRMRREKIEGKLEEEREGETGRCGNRMLGEKQGLRGRDTKRN